MAIESLSVRGVRGIRQLIKIELGGHSLLIYGDNGTGKSSFERALRWALVGDGEPNLDPAYSTEESYRRHVEIDPKDPCTEVNFIDGSSIVVTPGDVQFTKNGQALRDGCRQASPFLRRSELLDVMVSRPVDRFQYFESFLGLGKVDTTIEELATNRSGMEARRASLDRKLELAFEPFIALIPRSFDAPSTTHALVATGIAWASELGLALDGVGLVESADRVIDAAQSLQSGETVRAQGRLDQLLGEIEVLIACFAGISAVALQDLLEQKEELESLAIDSSAAELLEHAAAHFKNGVGTACPVCGAEVDWSATSEALNERLQALAQYRVVLGQIRNQVSGAQSAIQDLVRLEARLAEERSNVGGGDATHARNADLAALYAIPQSEVDRAWLIIVAIGPAQMMELATQTAAKAAAEARSIRAEIPEVKDTAAFQTAKAFFEKLINLHPQMLLLESELATLRPELKIYDKLLAALRRARQDVARETLAAIAAVVSEYYAAIHPPGGGDDVTGAPTIDVQRHGKGSAFVRGEFDGRQMKDPAWAYSDGHLDTVAICIFLALRRFRADQPNDPKLMVLDDIVVSIDLGHARRLIALLKEAFNDHQILILTHNGLFAHWCTSLIPGLRKLQIKSWSLATGPTIGDYRSARERIEDALQCGTSKEIAMRLMEMLDEWTSEARYAFSVAVPAKIGEQYTLTEIWEPLAKAIRGLSKSLGSDLGGATSALEVLVDVPKVRNLLAAHDNDFAKEFPRSTMLEIGKAACALVDALYCGECRNFVSPTPNRSEVAIMHCPKHHIQYVKMPKQTG